MSGIIQTVIAAGIIAIAFIIAITTTMLQLQGLKKSQGQHSNEEYRYLVLRSAVAKEPLPGKLEIRNSVHSHELKVVVEDSGTNEVAVKFNFTNGNVGRGETERRLVKHEDER